MHDPGAVVLAVASILAVVAAGTVLICACICGARDDRLAEAWREERERNAAALDQSGITSDGGWRYR